MRDPSLHILQHALGLDDYGRDHRRGGKHHPFDTYRNHYVLSRDCDSWDLCMAHVEAGRMVRHEPRELFGGDGHYCFTVTEAGRAFVRDHSPKKPKVSRAKERYLDWLEIADVNHDLTFGQFLKQGCRL